MKPRYPLNEFEKHIVRETPEMGWDDATTAEAYGEQAPVRLPIDLPPDLSTHAQPSIDDDPEPWQQLTAADWSWAIAVLILVIVVLWVVL